MSEEGSLPTAFVLGGLKRYKSPHPVARDLKVLIIVFTGFSCYSIQMVFTIPCFPRPCPGRMDFMCGRGHVLLMTPTIKCRWRTHGVELLVLWDLQKEKHTHDYTT